MNNFDDLTSDEMNEIKRELWRRVRIVQFENTEDYFQNIGDEEERKELAEKFLAESKEEVMRLSMIILAVKAFV